MASVTNRPSADMSNPAVFSYAQAAKGHTSNQPASSPVPLPTTPQSKDDTALSTAASPAAANSITPHDAQHRDPARSPRIEAELVTQDPEITTLLNGPGVSVASIVDHSTGQGKEEDVRNAEPRNAADETSTALATQASRPGESIDPKKTRKLKKSNKNTEKGTDQEDIADLDGEKEAPKPVLSEAPIPSVNVWHQRIEQAAARAKGTPATNAVSKTLDVIMATEESKKKAPVTETEPVGAVQGGASAERVQKKPGDGVRSADQSSRRNAPRGSRLNEKEDKLLGEPLPLVADAALWPTPVSAAAVDEGKRKSQDRADRGEKEGAEDSGPIKRQKEKWVTMPYVPTVNFQTPLPPRPSRGRGSGRAGRETNTRGQTAVVSSVGPSIPSPGGDKSGPLGVASTSKTGEPRPRENGGGLGRAASLPPAATKRNSLDGSYTREQRKPSVPSAAERPRDVVPESLTTAVGKSEFPRPRPEGFLSNGDQYHARSSQGERRGDSAPRSVEYSKDANALALKESGQSIRERGEPRQDRGRGGYRGRGTHVSSASTHASQSSYPLNGQFPTKSLGPRQNGPYSPPANQGLFVQGMMPSQPRPGGGRGNARLSQGNAAGRGAPNASGAKLHSLNTSNAPFYPPANEFSPFPYGTAWEPTLVHLIMLQVEYYLSVDNLCKDFYIRKRMDSQGFVPFFVIAQFNRMRELAPSVDAIRFACEQSEKIDFVVGAEDGVERLRLRERWDRFVLSMEERVEDARNDGPQQIQWRSRHGRLFPGYPGPLLAGGYPTASPTSFPATFPAEEQAYGPYRNGTHFEASPNGGDVNGHGYSARTSLSAAVPDFSPNGPMQPLTLESATTFTDQQAESLTLLFTSDKREIQSSTHRPSISAPLANGSVEALPYAGSGLAPASPGANGVPAGLNDGTSVNELMSRPGEAVSPTAAHRLSEVMWAGDQKQAGVSDQETTRENYPDFRVRAIAARQNAKPGETPQEMKFLYEFWSHFLISNFNPRMYEEFRSCAIEDAMKETPSRVGLSRLMTYYDEVLFGRRQRVWGSERPFAELFSQHYEEARRVSESGKTMVNGGLQD